VLDHLTYDAFGLITSQTDAAFTPHFSYTGREFDADLDLYDYRARYYDPHLGRFISEDPMSFAADDASCIPTVQPAAGTSGSVRITSASGGSFTGTYTVGFETGEQVNGEFHTANCPGLATFLSGTTHPCG